MTRRKPQSAALNRMLDHPVLSHEMHLELFAAMRPPHAPAVMAAAREELVTHNLRIAATQAFRARARFPKVGIDDLVGSAFAALIGAVDRFDPALGFRFSTFAARTVWFSLLRDGENLGRTIAIPVYLRDGTRGRDECRAAAEAAAGVQSLAGWDAADLAARAGADESRRADDRAKLLDAVGRLDPRAAEILRRRYGIGGHGPQLLQEVGDAIGVTRERVRQIQARAEWQLRLALGADADPGGPRRAGAQTIAAGGREFTAEEWAERLGITPAQLRRRVHRRGSVDVVLGPAVQGTRQEGVAC